MTREVETFVIDKDLAALADRLARRRSDERCVVLASGDPLFFGIGRFLIERLGRDEVEVEPSVSSLQLAFARLGIPWEDATIASVHGRPLDRTLIPLLRASKVGLLTRDGDSPSEVSAFYADRDAAYAYRASVCENLGAGDERITVAPLAELAGRRFADLNVLVLERTEPARPLGRTPGLPDGLFEGPAEGPNLLTHADVRVVTLSRFRDLPEGPIWDVGAGLGGVSIELAHAFPAVEGRGG